MTSSGVLTVALALVLGAGPAAARSKVRYGPDHKTTERISQQPFGDIPKGPLQILVSIDQQKLHLYSDGVHVADTSVATGVPSLPTPLGVFSVIQKQVFHRSNLYSNAPMPFMQRITWSGVALHEGESIGHRASHGCIRMPRDFALRLYGLTKIGARVIVADPELKPVEFADPHLFVHKDKPPDPPVPATVSLEATKTAAVADAVKPLDPSKALDVAPTDAAFAVQPAALGLRVATDTVTAASIQMDRKADPAADGAMHASASTTANAAQSDAVPLVKPADQSKDSTGRKVPISIFVSRKEKKIYVRQNFEPLFDAAITIGSPDQPLGTHVFTAMEFKDDRSSFRWTVVSLPGDPPKPVRHAESAGYDRYGRPRRREDDSVKVGGPLAPPQTPEQALARIDIPQPTIDAISALVVPGSSLIVSDQGLGDETGEGTDFVVVTH